MTEYYEECINCGCVFPAVDRIDAGTVTIHDTDKISTDTVYCCSEDCLAEYEADCDCCGG